MLRHWGKRAALALAAFAAGIGAVASVPEGEAWSADPDSQYLLDLTVRQFRLGENLRAYPTPEGTCLVFGDLLTMLDTPVTVDLAAGKASGWAFKDDHRILIDRKAGTFLAGARSGRLAASDIRDTPDGWCVDSSAASAWFGIDFKVITGASAVRIESQAKLPVELALERQNRAKHLHKAAMPLESGPIARIPYRMWRAPALDFVVDAGVTYSAREGVRIDRRAAITAAGEIAGLSYEAQAVSGRRGALDSLRVRAYRSDPDGGLLGPLKATHFGVGDVGGLTHPLLGGGQGRGFEVTNKPLFAGHSFDKTRFEGLIQPGWQVELYRNGQLLDFASDNGTGRYAFEGVDLQYGENRFEIILYGPQGQQETRLETVNVGPEQLPPGETRWWIGANQPGRDILGVTPKPVTLDPDDAASQIYLTPRAQAAMQVEHGVDKRTSVAALAGALLLGDERLSFVEGSVRRSVGPALVEAGVAYQGGGGLALRAQALAKIGPVSLTAEAAKAENFFYEGRVEEKMSKLRVAADAPFMVGKVPANAHAEYRLLDRPDSRVEHADSRISANLGRISTGVGLAWERETLAGGVVNSRFDLRTMAAGRVGKIRVRGEGVWEVSPEASLRSADLAAYWSASERADWEVGVGYDQLMHRTRARVSHVRKFDSFAIAGTLEAASDKTVAAGFNLIFSLDANRGGFHPTRQPLAARGQVKANIFRDDNDNGRRDPGEEAENGVLLTGGVGADAVPSNANGVAQLNGLTPYERVAIGIDSTTLSDPALTPRHAIQTVVPRAGVTATIDIPLVGAGDIEAVLVGNDGSGIEGADIEVLDASGNVVATARSDYDGFFLFERLAYGSYRFRLASDSARALRLDTALDAKAVIDASHTVIRLGPVSARKTTTLAAAD